MSRCIEMGDRVEYSKCYNIKCSGRFEMPIDFNNLRHTTHKIAEPYPVYAGADLKQGGALVVGWGKRVMANYEFGIDYDYGEFGEIRSQQPYGRGKMETVLYCKDEKPSSTTIFLVRLCDVIRVRRRDPVIAEPIPLDHALWLPTQIVA